ncbi:E3 SUMO-protein ligase ZBED1-like [Rhinoderma darwinii]|uniref:E3 SUMO-protein ligase ZBED1-like n=1 Tax=Rhinoderma darwinii TaxID=43563 RepID=UPI003F673525
MKQRVRNDMKKRYENENLQLILNIATYLDPRFKESFVSMEKDVKEELLQRASNVSLPEGAEPEHQSQKEFSEEEHDAMGQVAKKKKTDLESLLSSIITEKRGSAGSSAGTTESEASSDKTSAEKLSSEFMLYSQMKEISPEEDPLAWWQRHATSLPNLAHFAKAYLCVPASSCASERVFSTSGLICSPRRMRLTEDHIDTLVFLAKNLKQAKKLPSL